MATLYLHIGTMKTGTTAIQTFMYHNAEALSERGCLYPTFTPKYNGLRKSRNAHFLIPATYDERVAGECIEKMSQLATACPTIVMSDEGLYGAHRSDPQFWERLRARFEAYGIDVKVIVYLRRQDEYLHSFWAQRVKVGNCLDTFEDYLYAREVLQSRGERIKLKLDTELSYMRFLDHLEPVLGHDAIIVRPYERAGFFGGTGDIIPDFFNAIGVELSDAYKKPKEALVNPTLKDSVAEYKRLMNYVPEYINGKSRMIPQFVELQNALADEGLLKNRTGLLPEVRAHILERCADDNRAVAIKYLGRTDNPVLFKDLNVEKGDEAAVFDEEEIRRNAHMLAEIVGRNAKSPYGAADIKGFYESLCKIRESSEYKAHSGRNGAIERLRLGK